MKKLIPDLEVTYEPDFRLAIAESWPNSLDDSESKKDWDWEYKITPDEMARKTLLKIDDSYKKGVRLNI